MSVRENRIRPAPLLFGIVATLFLLGSHPVRAQHRLTLQAFGGGAWNVPMTVSVHQEGEPDLDFSAHWETKPFVQPLYWVVKASLEDRSGAWELQFLHDKLYLTHGPQEIAAFEVTHGFNLVTLARSFPLGEGFSARGGAGIVLAHAESTIGGELEENAGNAGGAYELTGPAFLAGVGWQYPFSRYFFVSAEAFVTAAYAKVPVARGHATFWNVAFHGLIGLGVRFGGPLPPP